MMFNPGYAELLVKEQQRVFLEEAEKQRLIRLAILANPSKAQKIWKILRDRWQIIWTRKSEKEIYPPISRVPKSSTSL